MLALTVVLALQVSSASPPAPPTDQTFARARRALDAELIDYPNARFRDVRANEHRVCGYVNGRNRIGGFSGWQRFGIALLPDTTILRFEANDRIGLLATLCDGDDAPPAAPDYAKQMAAQGG